MYKYVFVLSDDTVDAVLGNTFRNVLEGYFQLRGSDIINGVDIKEISIGPKAGADTMLVPDDTVAAIVSQLRAQNIVVDPQQKACQDMVNTCPDGSKDAEPIMYEDWCDDIPYQEFVKNDNYLSQCYRLSTLIKTFAGGLTAKKGGNPMPQWPKDVYSNEPIPSDRLIELYNQAVAAKIDIPIEFEKFIDGIKEGLFDEKVAMAGQYIGNNDSINPQYLAKFVIPATEKMFGITNKQDQEMQDVLMAQQLAQQFAQ